MYQILKKYFGYTEFRPLQKEIISAVLNQQDTFVLMPTGGGKSLCYQLPSEMLTGLTIVVSPLISLMKDQVDSLCAIGIKAAFINSSLTYQEVNNTKSNIKEGKINLLYVAPERLMMPNFLTFIENLNVSLFAIDEAHCISEWGHNFRPEYLKLPLHQKAFGIKQVLLLTATATQRVIDDMCDIIQRNMKEGSTIIFVQIKEKFGQLRIYSENVSEDIYDLVDLAVFKAEQCSACICECCGSESKLKNKNGWLSTVCDNCKKED